MFICGIQPVGWVLENAPAEGRSLTSERADGLEK